MEDDHKLMKFFVLFLFDFTENVAEENLFYIVSPKDLVLAKV